MDLPPKSKQEGGNDYGPDQGSSTGNHKKVKPGFFSADALGISGGLVCLVVGAGFHIAGGWFHIAGFALDFLVVCCGLTIITHHVEEFELWGVRYWLSLGIAFVIFTFLTIFVVRKENVSPKPESPAEIIGVPQPDYIEGTDMPKSDIKHFFALGYVVVRYKDARWTYEPDKDWNEEIIADFSKIEVTPDFAANMVVIHIPNYGIKFKKGSKLFGFQVVRNELFVTLPMDDEKVRLLPSMFQLNQNSPRLWFATLSNNQLHPVFVLGFRILSPNGQP